MPFSVFYQADLLHVFCQNTDGEVLLFTYRENSWHSRIVLNDGRGGILLTPMISDEGLCILYNGFADDAESLYKRVISGTTGEWQQAVTIDHHTPFTFAPYIAQATGPEHLILFYQLHGLESEECQVGYREVTPSRVGAFQRFLNINGTLLDASFLTTYDVVHVLMIVRTDFSCQLLYRKKTDDAFTPPNLLWEAPKMEQCLLTIIGNELHITCMIGGKLNRVVSTDFGDTFGQMGLYKRKFCAEPVKADLIINGQMKGCFARQVYVDRHAPWDVQMIPDLYPAFYPEGIKESDHMKELKDSLEAAQLAMDAKDRQILELLHRAQEKPAE